jgi:hypothetical protein
MSLNSDHGPSSFSAVAYLLGLGFQARELRADDVVQAVVVDDGAAFEGLADEAHVALDGQVVVRQRGDMETARR